MMSMSISYEASGRRHQKARTRTALIRAARRLLERGVTPNVEDAAAEASISRATAYRYFPNQDALIVAAHPEVEAVSLLGAAPPVDVEARLDTVVTRLAGMFLAAEASYRAMLRLSLSSDADGRRELALRKGRRFIWITEALEPVRGDMKRAAFERLVHAVAAAVGIEALVTLTDLAGISRKRAVEVMRWSARSLLKAALDDPSAGA